MKYQLSADASSTPPLPRSTILPPAESSCIDDGAESSSSENCEWRVGSTRCSSALAAAIGSVAGAAAATASAAAVVANFIFVGLTVHSEDRASAAREA